MSKSSKSPSTAGAVPLPSSKRGPKAFFNEVGREMKKVSWPARAETNRLTGVVLAMCVLTIALLFGLQEAFRVVITLLTEGF